MTQSRDGPTRNLANKVEIAGLTSFPSGTNIESL